MNIKAISLVLMMALVTPATPMETSEAIDRTKNTGRASAPLKLTPPKISQLKDFTGQTLCYDPMPKWNIPQTIELILAVEMGNIESTRVTLAGLLGQEVLEHLKNKLESIHLDKIQELEKQLFQSKGELNKAIADNSQRKQQHTNKEEIEKAMKVLEGFVAMAAQHEALDAKIKTQKEYIQRLTKTHSTAVEDIKYLFSVVSHLSELIHKQPR